MTRLHTNTAAIDSMVWLWGLSVGLQARYSLAQAGDLPAELVDEGKALA